MPVLPTAVPSITIAKIPDAAHSLAGASTRLVMLTDIIPPWGMSIGDVLMYLSMILMIANVSIFIWQLVRRHVIQ
jgi:hypothetical protein